MALGFSDSAVVWFRAYLTNRTQSVGVNCVLSDPQSIAFGSLRGPFSVRYCLLST